MDLEELEKKVKELGAEIERLKTNQKSKQWVPEIGQTYWFVWDDGIAGNSIWGGDLVDNNRLAMGNVYETNNATIIAVERQKAKVRIWNALRELGDACSTLEACVKGDNIL